MYHVYVCSVRLDNRATGHRGSVLLDMSAFGSQTQYGGTFVPPTWLLRRLRTAVKKERDTLRVPLSSSFPPRLCIFECLPYSSSRSLRSVTAGHGLKAEHRCREDAVDLHGGFSTSPRTSSSMDFEHGLVEREDESEMRGCRLKMPVSGQRVRGGKGRVPDKRCSRLDLIGCDVYL